MVTHIRGIVAFAYAKASWAPWRIIPRHSRSFPGWNPGVSTKVIIGILKASQKLTNRALFCDAEMSKVPASD